MSIRKRRDGAPSPVERVAGNGLLDRRALLGRGIVFAGAMGPATGTSITGAAAEPLQNDPWSPEMGSVVPAYPVPPRFEKDVIRTRSNPNNEFRNWPSRTHFRECTGNSAPMFSSEPLQVTAQALHGLVSNAEWTGVLLSTLLEETGIDPNAKWLFAEGGDSLGLHRSVPIKKALDDAIIVLYQNGERLMPGNGYPVRLLLHGSQGNMNVKHVRRYKLIDQPAMSFFESKTYSQILPNNKMWLFHFTQEVKSFISYPSFGHALKGAGFYEISGVAYSGNGRIAKVMVSADGGKSWAQAALQEPVLPKAFTRFRMPWRWDGQP